MAVPKLRFKDSEGREFPEWEEKKLGDFTERIKRKAPENSIAPVMMIAAESGFIYQKDRYSRENAGKSLTNYTLLKQEEFSYNHGYSKLRNYGSVFILKEPEARVPFVYHSFKLLSGVGDFWGYYLNSGLLDRTLKKTISSTARMDGLLNISYEAYMDINVRVPSLTEQQKIANFLTTYDTMIDTQTKRVEAMKTRKKGLLQKIFSQKIRFKDEQGQDYPKWEGTEFGKVVSRKTSTEFSSNDLPGIEYEDIISGVGRLNKDVYTKQCDKKGIVFSKGDVLYGKLRPYLKNWLLPDFKGVAIGDFWVLTSKLLKAPFLYYFLQSSTFTKVANTSIGTKMPRADWKLVHRMTMEIPSFPEQEKIADFLIAVDTQIEVEEKRLETMKTIKKGLLQQMFI